MSFGAPLWLLAGAIVLVVILLHARRRRAVVVPSLQIWRLIDAAPVRRARLRWPPASLLLWLQIAIIFLAALALAQPRVGGGAVPDHIVYVLDASGSMRASDGGSERFAEARRALLADIRSLPTGTRFSVVIASGRPHIAVARQVDPRGAEPILERLQANDAAPTWPGVAGAIAPLLREEEEAQLVLITDGADGTAESALAGLEGASLREIIVGTGRIANAALVADIVADASDPDLWHIDGRVLMSGGAAPEALAVRFRPDGSDRFLDWDTIPVPPPAADGPDGERPFSAVLELPGPGVLVVELPPDGALNDNAFHAVLAPERQARVLILGDAPDLVRAFQAVPHVEVLAAGALPADDELYDLVVVADVAVARRPETNVLWLARGGLAADGPPPAVDDPTITGWDEEHPLSLDVAWWDAGLPLAFAVPRLEGATVLAEASGMPLVQARTTPHGREVRLAAALDGSPWIAQPGFPLFVSNLVDWLRVPRGPVAARMCTAGEPCPIEPRLLSGVVTRAGTEAWRAPAAAWLSDGVEDTFVPEHTGLHELTVGAARTVIAVNGANAVEQLGDGTAARLPAPSGGGGLDLAPWLLSLALVALVVEIILARRAAALRQASADPRTRRRQSVQLALRVVAVLLVLAAILQLPLPEQQAAENRVVLLGPEAGTAAAEALAMAGAGIVTAEPTAILRDIGAADPGPVPPAEGTTTDPAEPLRLAAAMLPGNAAGRIVLAGWDGDTAGRASAALADLAPGVTIDVVPLPAMPAAEVLVETITAPDAARAGDDLPVAAVILAGRDGPATVTVLRDGETVVRTDVDLRAGRNVIDAVVPAGTATGEILVEFEVASAADIEPGNNRDGRLVPVSAASSVLIVTPTPDWGEFLADALAVQDVTATVATPDRAPFYMRDWLAYDVVVMLNVPAIDLTTMQQEQIRDYVGIHGRGLLLLGGEYAFGPGGYYQTPLEEVSPLSSRVPREAPVAALGFVLDRSGSMRAEVGDQNRLDIAKQATVSAVELLHPESQVVVVVFDSEAHLVVPLQDPKDDAAVAAALAPVSPGGGTVLFPGLTQAFAEIDRADATAKHIVVMTDGLIEQFIDFGPLVGEMRQAGITISAVAIGDVADTEVLQSIARLGGGSFHATRDFRALPGILAQEALLLSGSPVRDTPTPVFWVDRSDPFLDGLPDTFPLLRSYVLTSAQPGATVHLALIDDEGETVPILASWHYGAGRVLGFASHGAGSGTQDWLELGAFPLLWSQAIRHFSPATPTQALQPEILRRGDAVIAIAELQDPDGNPVTDAAVTVAPADGTAGAVPLAETAPGHYAAALGVLGPGTHRLAFTAGELTASAGIHIGYPARLNFGRANTDFIEALAVATGGDTIGALDEIGPAPARWTFGAGAWWPWLVAALAIFIAELVLRYAPPARLKVMSRAVRPRLASASPG
ncbi:MAG: VWA domain-containing protein [Bauldia sp.]